MSTGPLATGSPPLRVGPAELVALARSARPAGEVLGSGELGGVSLRLSAHAFSATAKEKIVAAGGSATELS